MYAVERENNYNNERILDVIRHEIEKIRRSMPKFYDGIAQFLAISRPIIEVVLMNCGDWTDQFPKEGRGKKPFSPILMSRLRLSILKSNAKANINPKLLFDSSCLKN